MQNRTWHITYQQVAEKRNVAMRASVQMLDSTLDAKSEEEYEERLSYARKWANDYNIWNTLLQSLGNQLGYND